MKEEKFTKGPWSADSPYSTMFMVVDSQQQPITEVQCGTDEHGDYLACEKEKANAHLIAAAPELYTALESCMSELLFMINKHNTHNMSDNSYEYDYQTVHEAQMVLAKARGEK